MASGLSAWLELSSVLIASIPIQPRPSSVVAAVLTPMSIDTTLYTVCMYSGAFLALDSQSSIAYSLVIPTTLSELTVLGD